MKKQLTNNFLNTYKEWLILIIINTSIAIMLTVLTSNSFLINFVYSQCIGFSISSLIAFIQSRQKTQYPALWVLIVGVVFGSIIGLMLGTLFSKIFFSQQILGDISLIEGYKYLVFSLIIGTLVTFYFVQKSLRSDAEKQIIVEKLKQQESQSALIDTELKLLQAQIEPHFLFNTLSNVISLIDAEPKVAKEMLQSFSQYLRVSLDRTRDMTSTVQNEVELLEAYLKIQSIRMGERLKYKVLMQDETKNINLPPLLIQPLVENAIKHGLEKSVEGGEIRVRFELENKKLKIIVFNTGEGIENNKGDGIGLTNVEARLKSTFGKQATMQVHSKANGITITLKAPIMKQTNA